MIISQESSPIFYPRHRPDRCRYHRRVPNDLFAHQRRLNDKYRGTDCENEEIRSDAGYLRDEGATASGELRAYESQGAVGGFYTRVALAKLEFR